VGAGARVVTTRISVRTDGPARAKHLFLFAHGAGAGMDHAFMNTVARGMGERGIRVVRFEFPYMEKRRTSGKRGAPDRQPVLLDTWRRVITEQGGGSKVCIGGKSMGGRMASMIADEMKVRGLICFGYPFHPPGQPEKTRVAHLADLRTPTLILQGTRDPFGTPEDVRAYSLSKAIRIEWVEGGDHSLKGSIARAIEAASLFTIEQ
jgi:predicted alpha/beta-hydrolase family hydrolase